MAKRSNRQAQRPQVVGDSPTARRTTASGAGSEGGHILASSLTITFAAVASSFSISLILYLFTLAPSVTFEDSGELAAAASSWGVPHEPGYPLWTILGHLFTLLPFGDVVWRLNLMSAVCMALAAALTAWATLLVIDLAGHGLRPAATATRPRSRTGRRPANDSGDEAHPTSAWLPSLRGGEGVVACGAALAAGLLFATAHTAWEQSLITEVYGLNALTVATLLLLTVVWTRACDQRSRGRLFLAVCFVLGLGLTVHDTNVLLIPVLAVYGLVVVRRLRPSWRRLLAGIGLSVAGLLPYLYLPLAASRHPAMDWGNPSTWTNFWRTITRHQYRISGHSGVGATLHELRACLTLLSHQWFAGLLVLAVLGIVVLFRRQRGWFWLALLLLAVTGPVTTYITDFPVATSNSFVNADNLTLVSVFYIPSYLVLALLMGVGASWLAGLAASWLSGSRQHAPAAASLISLGLALVVVAVPLVTALTATGTVTMRHYGFADAYIADVFRIATPRSLVMVDRDQWGFPLMEAQIVDHERPDVVVLDQELLRRSWYLQDLSVQQPALIAGSRPLVDEFLRVVKPFEEGVAYDAAAIDDAYYAMIKSFVDQYESAGRDVYFTYQPDQRIVAAYSGESLGVVLEARRSAPGKTAAALARWLTPVDLAGLEFPKAALGSTPLDRNAKMIASYYAGLLAARATLLAGAGRSSEAAQAQALSRSLSATSSP